MGIGRSGGVRVRRLPAFLILLTTCFVGVLALAACGGAQVEEPAPTVEQPRAPVLVATPVPQPPPVVVTQPAMVPAEAPEAVPAPTRLVIAPGAGPLPRRADTPTPEPTEIPTPAPEPTATPEPTAEPTPTLMPRPTARPTPTSTPVPPTIAPRPTPIPAPTTPTGSAPVVPQGAQIITTLAPLGNNLKWVVYFDNDTKAWSLYDPSGTFTVNQLPGILRPPTNLSDYRPLTQITLGKPYHFNFERNAEVEIGGKTYKFTAGYNFKGW